MSFLTCSNIISDGSGMEKVWFGWEWVYPMSCSGMSGIVKKGVRAGNDISGTGYLWVKTQNFT